MVSQFQGMVLEEKSPANRPSFADVRRRNNEVSLNSRFCATGKPRRFTRGASASVVQSCPGFSAHRVQTRVLAHENNLLVQSVSERLFSL